MGSCVCTESRESRLNSQVERDIHEEKRLTNKVKKILFLGSGGSGKSTIFKQLRGIYGDPYSPAELRNFVTYIHEQCINQMKHALDVLSDYQGENHQRYVEEQNADRDIPDLSEMGMEAADYIQSLHHTKYKLNDEIVTALKMLWDEPAIKKMYELRNITGIEDSSQYFWDILDTIADPSYIPDLEDTLLVRKRTTGTLCSGCHDSPEL